MIIRKKQIIVLFIFLFATQAFTESLWPGTGKSLVSDRCARSVGDILTVIVVESASATLKANTDTKKATDVKAGPGIGPIYKMLKEVSFSGDMKSGAQGSTGRSSSLNARITVTVTRVLPNGNLEIQGTREVETNKERQVLRLSGVVRPEDISPDNTILSSFIADANITLHGRGDIAEKQREGIVTRLLRWLF